MKRLALTLTLGAVAVCAMAGQPLDHTLYEQLGGIHKIAAIVDKTVDMDMKDMTLMSNERFKMLGDKFGAPVVKFILTNTLASAAGGPQKMSFDKFFSIAKWTMLTDEQRRHLDMNFMAAMDEMGVAKEAQMKAVDWCNTMFMKAKPMAPEMEMFKDKKSLYARLGGFGPIITVVDTFINELSMDPTIGSNPNVVKALTDGHVSGAGLKYLVSEQLLEASGGPFKYSGRSMKESHKGLMINEKEWAAGGAILAKVLDMYKVPAKEKGEILAAITSAKKDIVTKH